MLPQVVVEECDVNGNSHGVRFLSGLKYSFPLEFDAERVEEFLENYE